MTSILAVLGECSIKRVSDRSFFGDTFTDFATAIYANLGVRVKKTMDWEANPNRQVESRFSNEHLQDFFDKMGKSKEYKDLDPRGKAR